MSRLKIKVRQALTLTGAAPEVEPATAAEAMAARIDATDKSAEDKLAELEQQLTNGNQDEVARQQQLKEAAEQAPRTLSPPRPAGSLEGWNSKWKVWREQKRKRTQKGGGHWRRKGYFRIIVMSSPSCTPPISKKPGDPARGRWVEVLAKTTSTVGGRRWCLHRSISVASAACILRW